MASRFRIAVLLGICLLALPAGAWAQTSTVPREGQELSRQPPVDLDGRGAGRSDAGGRDPESGGPAGAAELADTGSDVRLVALAGAALLLIGLGLRLRTADADLY